MVDDRRDGTQSGNAGDVAGTDQRPPQSEEGDAPSFAEMAEAAFLGEARARGEVVAPARAAVESTEEVADSRALPALEELVKRIPPDVRETLDELFRVKFVAVRRVPAKALRD